MTTEHHDQEAASLHEAQTVGRRVVISSIFMVVGRVAIRLIGVVSTLILVRLLVPEDFGVIGVAASAVTVAETITQMNLGMAVVRHQVADRAIFDTAWTLNLLRSLLLGGLLAGSAPWLSDMLSDARVGPVVVAVALTIVLDSLHSPGLFRLQRALRFDQIFRFEIAVKLTAFAITITLALVLRNYWCLVLGNLLSRAITIPLSYWVAPHRPRLTLTAGWELLHFSKWMLAENLCGAVDGQVGNLSIARLAGLPALGMWQISWQVAAMPVTELAVPIRGPIFSGYAKVQHDRALLREHFLSGFGFLIAIITPLSAGVALVAPEIERLALGAAFAGAAPLIVLCALYVYADAVAHFTLNLFVVLDAQRLMVVMHAVLVLIRVPVVIAGAWFAGAEGAGAALVATGFLNSVVWHATVARRLGHRLTDVWAEAWRSVSAALVMTGVVLAVRGALPSPSADIPSAVFDLGTLACIGAIVHVAVQYALWRIVGSPPRTAEARLISIASNAAIWMKASLLRRM